jgi:VIT1/CCC1 family predicted Fe2+/Mn2+ transporter
MSYVRKEEREHRKTLNELMADLSGEVRDLLRQEMLLAKNEMSAKISRGINDIRSAAMGGALLHAGFFAIVAAVVIALGNAISYGLSALVVGVAALVIGYYMVKKGLADMRKIDVTPQQTISSFREDRKWLKRKI